MEEGRSYKIVGGYHDGRTWEGKALQVISLYEDQDIFLLYGDKPCNLTIKTHEYRMKQLVVGAYTQMVYVPLWQTFEETMKLLGFDKYPSNK